MRRSGRRGNDQIRLRIGSHYPCGLSLGLSAVSKSENAALGDKVAAVRKPDFKGPALGHGFMFDKADWLGHGRP
jgi:hypothetical protein